MHRLDCSWSVAAVPHFHAGLIRPSCGVASVTRWADIFSPSLEIDDLQNLSTSPKSSVRDPHTHNVFIMSSRLHRVTSVRCLFLSGCSLLQILFVQAVGHKTKTGSSTTCYSFVKCCLFTLKRRHFQNSNQLAWLHCKLAPLDGVLSFAQKFSYG